jgi:phosphate transport system substrate-binding protein
VISVAACAAIAIAVAGCGGSDETSGSTSGGAASTLPKSSGTINGAGATFPAPVYQEWAAEVKDQTGLTVNYQAIGSGGGIAQFTAKTVDFGATDSAMKDDEVQEAQKVGKPVHIPTVFGAVTVAYKVQGVDTGLKLDGSTTADLFLGKITKWNDPAIASLNPDLTLPDENVTVCHRSDESGTTALFTTYLDAYSATWKSKVGSGKAVQWPTGTGGKGNDGVAACVSQNEGSVGYVELAYALQNNFTVADMQNKAGEGLTLPDDLRFDAIDAPGAQAYPIASATFLLVWQDMCKAGLSQSTAQDVKIWLDFALGPGQESAPKLLYAPLPPAVLAAAKEKVAGLQCNGSPLAS